MKVSVQFPMHTKSENVLRSLPFVVANAPRGKQMGIAMSIAGKVRKQRAEVRRFLDSQLPRLKREVVPYMRPKQPINELVVKSNFFRVTIIRISAGELDTDGLHGALKAVRDEVAAWLGVDDSARSPASWRVGQQRGPRGVHAVRIEIDDDDPDAREMHRVCGTPIAKLGLVVGDVAHAPRAQRDVGGREPQRLVEEHLKELDEEAGFGGPLSLADRAAQLRASQHELAGGAPGLVRAWERAGKASSGVTANRRPRPEQEPLVFRRSYYEPPGQDEDANEVTLEELTGALFDMDQPPPVIRKGGRILRRRQDFHPALGEHWIYEPAPSVARAPREERAEARR